MRDEINENPRLFAIVCIISIVATVILAIFLLFIVWFPDRKKNIKQFSENDVEMKLGTYKPIFVSEKEVLEDYINYTLAVFAGGDEILLNEIVLPEYLTYKGIGKSELKKLLTKKGVIGKKLIFSDYRVTLNPRYGKIFEVDFKSYDGLFSDKLLIIEKSPNNFKISFDNFVGLDTKPKTYTKEGFRLNITEIKELTTIVSLKVTITNVSGHNMIINRENNYENIYLRLSTMSEIRMSSNWLSGDVKELSSEDTFNLDLEFLIKGLSSGSASSIIIKDVYDTLTKETKDIEFVI